MSLFGHGLPRLPEGWRTFIPHDICQSCQGGPAGYGFLRKRAGIRIQDSWYCSADCFEAASLRHFERLAVLSRAPRRTPIALMPLGLLLLSRGQISDSQLQAATAECRSSGATMAEALVRCGYATQEQITAALASQWGCPVFALKGPATPVQVRIPFRLLDFYRIAPVHFTAGGRKLLLGFVDRLDHQVLHAVEQMLGYATDPCFITPDTHRQVVQALGAGPKEEEVGFEGMSHPAEMARITRSYSLQVAAREARFSLCRDYCWVRLQGEQQALDLLFGCGAHSRPQ